MDFLFAILIFSFALIIIFSGYLSGSTVLLASGGIILILSSLSGLWIGLEYVEQVNSTSYSNGTIYEVNQIVPFQNDLITGLFLILIVFGLILVAEVAGRSDKNAD